MKFFQVTLLFVIFTISTTKSTSLAPFLGPSYPAPADFTSGKSLISIAWRNFTAQLSDYETQNTTIQGIFSSLGNYSFSVGVFSTLDAGLGQNLQYHYTADDIATGPVGSKIVTAESIFRIGSVSKVFTVYNALLHLGSKAWETPITTFVSGLKTQSSRREAILGHVDWDQVTLGALAGQMAGIPREAYPYNTDAAFQLPAEGIDPVLYGFPPLGQKVLNKSSLCAAVVNEETGACPEELYITDLSERAPVSLPWTRPTYSNAGYALLALALQNVTGSNFSALLYTDFGLPLNMSSTSMDVPVELARTIIPGGDISATYDMPAIGASGGIWSTTNDLARFGISILNSTLLSAESTRQWLKPITHTADPTASVGRPWEILRFDNPLPARTIDLYTKDGDVTGYSAYIILSPDHSAGFSILVAGTIPTGTATARAVLADTLSGFMIPAFEAQAAQEARLNYAGQYHALEMNSSITLAVDSSRGGGLIITSWISNSTNVLMAFEEFFQYDSIALFPTDVVEESKGSPQKVMFRAAYGQIVEPTNPGVFLRQDTTSGSWANADTIEYGGIGLDEFVFSVGDSGRAESVQPKAWRVKMIRF